MGLDEQCKLTLYYRRKLMNLPKTMNDGVKALEALTTKLNGINNEIVNNTLLLVRLYVRLSYLNEEEPEHFAETQVFGALPCMTSEIKTEMISRSLVLCEKAKQKINQPSGAIVDFYAAQIVEEFCQLVSLDLEEYNKRIR